ncbi:MAG: Gfo/Idh/MocA family oxidoreductase [Actinomycetota bacterium]
MTIRVGVAGVAGMGMFHVLTFGAHEGAELTALCDVWPKALDSAGGAAPDAKRFTDFAEMCAADVVDAVVIATPNAFHIEAVTTALEAGLHVYCEKPLANTVGDCRALAELAERHGRAAQIGFQHRFQHGYASAKRIVAAGGIGPLRRADMRATAWFRPNAYFAKRAWRASWEQAGGGVLMMQAIHQLDSYLWITGAPTRVTAHAWSARPDVQVEDDVYAVLEFGDAARGMLSASTLDPGGLNRLEFAGDTGALHVDPDFLRRAEWDEPTSTMLIERTNLFEPVQVAWNDVAPSGDAMTYDDSVKACQRDFLDAIEQGRAPSVDPVEATRSVEVANAVYLSAVTGEPVTLPLDAASYEEAFRKMCADELKLPEAR